MVDLTSKCISFFSSCPYMANLGRCLIFSCNWDKSPHQIFFAKVSWAAPNGLDLGPTFCHFFPSPRSLEWRKEFYPSFLPAAVRPSGHRVIAVVVAVVIVGGGGDLLLS